MRRVASTRPASVRCAASRTEPLVTVAGSRSESGVADGPAGVARFAEASPLAADAAGNVYVLDLNTIRRVTPDGVVTTVAGQQYSIGTQLGPLPGSLGERIGKATVGPDGALYVVVGGAILRLVGR